MGKKTFWTGVMVGAMIGGIASLLNKEARQYIKETSLTTLENLTFYYKNPVVGLKEVRSTINTLTNTVNETVDVTVNALEQVETTIERFSK